MKIGVIGLGNIAQKAYLPVMASMQDEVEWHLCTRNVDKMETIKKQYGFTYTYSAIDEWLNSGIEAAFVHVATAAHSNIIRKLLENGISVYVDKPITDDLKETKALIQLAEDQGLMLTAGFNRRFAPMVQKLKEIPDKKLILVQKDRVNNQEDVRFAIYDLFIHLVDTALYLLDSDPVSFQAHLVEKQGELKRIWLTLETEDTSCIVSMNYEAGANQEIMEVQSLAGIARLTNLVELTKTNPRGKTVTAFGDWDSTLDKRGFAPLIQQFINGVSNKENPVSAESTYASHLMCEKILEKYGY